MGSPVSIILAALLVQGRDRITHKAYGQALLYDEVKRLIKAARLKDIAPRKHLVVCEI